MAEIVFPRDGDRRKRADVVVFALVVVLVAALLVGAAAVRRDDGAAGPVRTIRMAGDSDYFTDPDVQRELELNGFRVEQNRKGTVGIADLPDLATGLRRRQRGQ